PNENLVKSSSEDPGESLKKVLSKNANNGNIMKKNNSTNDEASVTMLKKQ
ncbi:35659_t:CDS:2, partial [Racocetra persica]